MLSNASSARVAWPRYIWPQTLSTGARSPSSPKPVSQFQISQGSGSDPVWAPDGSAVYYLDGCALWHAELGDGSVRERRMLFEGNWATHCPGQAPVSTWDVHPDGASFVFVRNPGAGIGDAGPCTRNVPVEGVVNWFEELRERLGN